ncbi:hypothetical protein BDR26DRAFT_851266 [Obelidium mucronatum]|nr:hypothetical protein BDR26DRAFT_851266 [Obelidium mucronatum]
MSTTAAPAVAAQINQNIDTTSVLSKKQRQKLRRKIAAENNENIENMNPTTPTKDSETPKKRAFEVQKEEDEQEHDGKEAKKPHRSDDDDDDDINSVAKQLQSQSGLESSFDFVVDVRQVEVSVSLPRSDSKYSDEGLQRAEDDSTSPTRTAEPTPPTTTSTAASVSPKKHHLIDPAFLSAFSPRLDPVPESLLENATSSPTLTAASTETITPMKPHDDNHCGGSHPLLYSAAKWILVIGVAPVLVWCLFLSAPFLIALVFLFGVAKCRRFVEDVRDAVKRALEI